MTADVKQVVWGQELVELIEGVLQIDGLTFADDEADVRFTWCHGCAHRCPSVFQLTG